MIEGQISRLKSVVAILANVLVSQKHISARKGRFGLLLVDIVVESNDRGEGYLHIRCLDKDIGVNIHHGDTSLENCFDRILP